MAPFATGKLDLMMVTVFDQMRAAEWVLGDLGVPRERVPAGEVG